MPHKDFLAEVVTLFNFLAKIVSPVPVQPFLVKVPKPGEDGGKDRQTDEQTDRRTDRWKDRWMDGWRDVRTDGHTNG